ncbi:MAG: polyphosphate polymerase domain-containing protein [Candidatus Anstonellales archaeon]
MPRVEFKYLVPLKLKEELKENILPYLQYDYYSEIRPLKQYTVRSIYFDTPKLTAYYEKLSGLKIRNKFRIRGYNELTEDSKVFIEIKRKNENYVSKDRVPIFYSDLNDFLNHFDLSKIGNHTIEYERRIEAAKNFFFYYTNNKLKPIINVIYEREAFECKYGSGLRVTFDMNLRSFLTHTVDTLFNDESELIFPEHFILEIKYFQTLPVWVPRIINKYNLKKEAISKYAISIDNYIKNKINIHSI